MKAEFEKIKTEMEKTWEEQKRENERNVQRVRTNFESRVRYE